MKKLEKEYYKWMYNLVANDSASRNVTFHKLLENLYITEFIPTMERDSNIAQHGIDFRYLFGELNEYSKNEIDKMSNELGPCNMLEMMVSLSWEIENHIMDDPDQGDRTGQWFWSMIVSLGLGSMDDIHFNKRHFETTMSEFMNREYDFCGHGGLFIVNYPYRDMVNVDIWTQAMWYLDENNDFSVHDI